MESKLKQKRNKNREVLLQKTDERIIGGKYRIDANRIGQGVSSVVMAGHHIKTGKPVAIKHISHFLQNKHQSLRILRQIILLRILQHPNIVRLIQVIFEDQSCKQVYLILQYFPNDIKQVFRSIRILNQKQIIQIVFQILCGIKFCSQCNVLHRDLKPQNILITQDLSEVKLCDFGLARTVINQPGQVNKYNKKNSYQSLYELSVHVATRWYRAPQLILLERKYNSAIDIWSIGCIFGQLLSFLPQNSLSTMNRKVLFPGKACYPLSPPKGQFNYQKVNNFPHSHFDQLSVIFDILGTPDDLTFITQERARNYLQSFEKRKKKPFNKLYFYLPQYSEDFLEKTLVINPLNRITIEEAINHPLFDNIRQKYIKNIKTKGQVIHMNLQDLTIQQIKQLALKEAQYYKNLQKHQTNHQNY